MKGFVSLTRRRATTGPTQGTSADDDEERQDKSTNKEPKNKRSKEHDSKGTREHRDKRTTYCNKVKCPPLDVFFERTKGQEDRII